VDAFGGEEDTARGGATRGANERRDESAAVEDSASAPRATVRRAPRSGLR